MENGQPVLKPMLTPMLQLILTRGGVLYVVILENMDS